MDSGKTLTFDRIDRNILETLQKNARISNVELAQTVGLSPAPCLRRVQALEEAGVVEKDVVRVELIGFATKSAERGQPVDERRLRLRADIGGEVLHRHREHPLDLAGGGVNDEPSSALLAELADTERSLSDAVDDMRVHLDQATTELMRRYRDDPSTCLGHEPLEDSVAYVGRRHLRHRRRGRFTHAGA